MWDHGTCVRYSVEGGLRLEKQKQKQKQYEQRQVSSWPSSSSRYLAVLEMIQVAICNTDIEITKGYTPGFDHILGHEGVGKVVEIIDTAASQEESKSSDVVCNAKYMNKRVVVEINCPTDSPKNEDCVPRCYTLQNNACAGRIYMRNHAPDRTVLGIIGRDGLMAERVVVPLDNCILVPDTVSDMEAAFCEPLSAAYRLVEQHVLEDATQVAVVGDGKLGLLVAHVLGQHVRNSSVKKNIVLFGRHERKMELVKKSVDERVVVESVEDIERRYGGMFDCVVEASGSGNAITMSVKLCRPMGTLVLKSTCSVDGGQSQRVVQWSEIANDVVVNEKVVVGSRCGPMDVGMDMLASSEETRAFVASMVDRVYPLDDAIDAFRAASTKGSLKIQIRMK
jgi:threonine dehydrogenase-like Zn-dependent dehydrogenase